MARSKSETRQLTELVGVRFAQDDLELLRVKAAGLGVSVPELLRDLSLSSLRDAS